jgi:hypothetical protein
MEQHETVSSFIHYCYCPTVERELGMRRNRQNYSPKAALHVGKYALEARGLFVQGRCVQKVINFFTPSDNVYNFVNVVFELSFLNTYPFLCQTQFVHNRLCIYHHMHMWAGIAQSV